MTLGPAPKAVNSPKDPQIGPGAWTDGLVQTAYAGFEDIDITSVSTMTTIGRRVGQCDPDRPAAPRPRTPASWPDLYPLARGVGPVPFDDYDAGFEFGVKPIIAGFATVLAARGAGKIAEPA